MSPRANDPLSQWAPHPHCIVTVTRSCCVVTDNVGPFNREFDQWISWIAGNNCQIAYSSDLYFACHDCPFSKQEFNLRAKYWHYYSVAGPKNVFGWCTKSWLLAGPGHQCVLWAHTMCGQDPGVLSGPGVGADWGEHLTGAAVPPNLPWLDNITTAPPQQCGPCSAVWGYLLS